LYVTLDGSPRRGGPAATRAANVRTWPHCESSNVWTSAGTEPPPWAAFCESASGCQNVASCTVEPAASTTSGSFTGV